MDAEFTLVRFYGFKAHRQRGWWYTSTGLENRVFCFEVFELFLHQVLFSWNLPGLVCRIVFDPQKKSAAGHSKLAAQFCSWHAVLILFDDLGFSFFFVVFCLSLFCIILLHKFPLLLYLFLSHCVPQPYEFLIMILDIFLLSSADCAIIHVEIYCIWYVLNLILKHGIQLNGWY